MNKIINTKHQIAYNSLQLALALVDLDQKNLVTTGQMIPIFYSEIHIIMAIAEHPGNPCGRSGLEILGVTKGAVSEILKNWKKKILLSKRLIIFKFIQIFIKFNGRKAKNAHKNHMYYHSVFKQHG